MTGMDGDIGYPFHDRYDVGKVREVEPRVDSQIAQVECDGDEVDISGSLAVSEQRSFDACRACHERQCRRRDRAAHVVVRMQRDDSLVVVSEHADELLDHIGVFVRKAAFDRHRKIYDDFLSWLRIPFLDHAFAYAHGKVQVCVGEFLGRELEPYVRAGQRRRFGFDLSDRVDGRVHHRGLIHAENKASVKLARRDVRVNDRLRDTPERLDRACDQVRT